MKDPAHTTTGWITLAVLTWLLWMSVTAPGLGAAPVLGPRIENTPTQALPIMILSTPTPLYALGQGGYPTQTPVVIVVTSPPQVIEVQVPVPQEPQVIVVQQEVPAAAPPPPEQPTQEQQLQAVDTCDGQAKPSGSDKWVCANDGRGWIMPGIDGPEHETPITQIDVPDPVTLVDDLIRRAGNAYRLSTTASCGSPRCGYRPRR